jgi:hypothetical protein
MHQQDKVRRCFPWAPARLGQEISAVKLLDRDDQYTMFVTLKSKPQLSLISLNHNTMSQKGVLPFCYQGAGTNTLYFLWRFSFGIWE